MCLKAWSQGLCCRICRPLGRWLKRASQVELDWDQRSRSRFDATDSAGRTLGVFLAEPTWNGSAPASEEERFTRLRVPFFTVLASIPAVNLAHELALGSLGWDADLAFPVIMMLGAVAGFFLRTQKSDAILAGGMVVIISVYLVTSYGTISIPA